MEEVPGMSRTMITQILLQNRVGSTRMEAVKDKTISTLCRSMNANLGTCALIDRH